MFSLENNGRGPYLHIEIWPIAIDRLLFYDNKFCGMSLPGNIGKLEEVHPGDMGVKINIYCFLAFIFRTARYYLPGSIQNDPFSALRAWE